MDPKMINAQINVRPPLTMEEYLLVLPSRGAVFNIASHVVGARSGFS